MVTILAVEGSGVKIHRALGLVGVSVADDLLHKVDNLGNVFTDTSQDIGATDSQTIHILEELSLPVGGKISEDFGVADSVRKLLVQKVREGSLVGFAESGSISLSCILLGLFNGIVSLLKCRKVHGELWVGGGERSLQSSILVDLLHEGSPLVSGGGIDGLELRVSIELPGSLSLGNSLWCDRGGCSLEVVEEVILASTFDNLIKEHWFYVREVVSIANWQKRVSLECTEAGAAVRRLFVPIVICSCMYLVVNIGDVLNEEDVVSKIVLDDTVKDV